MPCGNRGPWHPERNTLGLAEKFAEPHVAMDKRFRGNFEVMRMLALDAPSLEILHPVSRSRRARSNLDLVKEVLMTKSGGVTLHVVSPAEGLWNGDGNVERDRIVTVEVMVADIDRDWWSSYRRELEARFHQEEIVVLASEIERL